MLMTGRWQWIAALRRSIRPRRDFHFRNSLSVWFTILRTMEYAKDHNLVLIAERNSARRSAASRIRATPALPRPGFVH
jgi:hypothetical protein